MSKVLVLLAHPLETKDSRTLSLTEVFLNAYQKENPNDTIERLDLYKSEVPEIDTDVFTAWKFLETGGEFKDLSAAQQQKIGRMKEILVQFKAADKIVLANPMWNLSFPPVVKAYIDCIVVKGETFKYTQTGPVGILEGKKFLHIQSNGGTYDGMDFGSSYIKGIFHFIGLTDFHELFIEGIEHHPELSEEITQQAQQNALKMATTF